MGEAKEPEPFRHIVLSLDSLPLGADLSLMPSSYGGPVTQLACLNDLVATVRRELRAAKNGNGSAEPPQLMTRKRAAEYLGISRKQVIRLEQNGKITGIKRKVKDEATRHQRAGKTSPRLYAKDDLDRYVRLVKGE